MMAAPVYAQRAAVGVDDVVHLEPGGGPTVIAPTANDVPALRGDVIGEWRYAQHVSNPEHGRVTVDAVNPLLLRYTPDVPALLLNDEFDYHAQDQLGSLVRATVRLVAPGSDEPESVGEPAPDGEEEESESECYLLFVVQSPDLVLELPCTAVRLR